MARTARGSSTSCGCASSSCARSPSSGTTASWPTARSLPSFHAWAASTSRARRTFVRRLSTISRARHTRSATPTASCLGQRAGRAWWYACASKSVHSSARAHQAGTSRGARRCRAWRSSRPSGSCPPASSSATTHASSHSSSRHSMTCPQDVSLRATCVHLRMSGGGGGLRRPGRPPHLPRAATTSGTP